MSAFPCSAEMDDVLSPVRSSLVLRAYDAGAFFSKLYASFEDKEGVWIRSSGQDRVVESARFFYQARRSATSYAASLAYSCSQLQLGLPRRAVRARKPVKPTGGRHVDLGGGCESASLPPVPPSRSDAPEPPSYFNRASITLSPSTPALGITSWIL